MFCEAEKKVAGEEMGTERMYNKPDNRLGTFNSNNRSYLNTAATLISLHFLIPRCDANFLLSGYERVE
jgi:hypothetical protein